MDEAIAIEAIAILSLKYSADQARRQTHYAVGISKNKLDTLGLALYTANQWRAEVSSAPRRITADQLIHEDESYVRIRT